MSDRQDKTFDPTPERIRKAREEGNLFRSREIISVGLLMVGVGMLALGAPYAFGVLKGLMARVFLAANTTPLTQASLRPLLSELGLEVGALLAPFFAVLMATTCGLSVLQSGWNVTFKPLVPKGNRISPLQGLKRIFSKRGLFEVFKALSKVVLVGPLVYLALRNHLPELLMLHALPLEDIVRAATSWILTLFAQMILALLVLSGLDFAFEKWRYKEDLKMSQQEVKDEAKEQEGNPQVKGKRRQLAREMARRPRLDHAVLQADVVVTNPTHYAVALRYDPEEGAAPRVLVKGIRKRALRIKALAREHHVPTVEDRPLARALYRSVPEEAEIPEELYPAVAAVLAELYRDRW